MYVALTFWGKEFDKVVLPKRSSPAHKALSDKLQSEIVAGKYDLGTPLPTETMLCKA